MQCIDTCPLFFSKEGYGVISWLGWGRDSEKLTKLAIGPEFPIVLRFPQWKANDYTAKLAETPALLKVFLAPLVYAGVDMFHCSTRRFWEPEFPGSDLNLAGWTKKLTGKPTITVGSVGLDGDFMSLFTEGKGASNTKIYGLIERLEREEFDLVAVGRALWLILLGQTKSATTERPN